MSPCCLLGLQWAHWQIWEGQHMWLDTEVYDTSHPSITPPNSPSVLHTHLIPRVWTEGSQSHYSTWSRHSPEARVSFLRPQLLPAFFICNQTSGLEQTPPFPHLFALTTHFDPFILI